MELICRPPTFASYVICIQPLGREGEPFLKPSNERQKILWNVSNFYSWTSWKFYASETWFHPASYTERPRIELSLLFGNFSMKQNHSQNHTLNGRNWVYAKEDILNRIRYFLIFFHSYEAFFRALSLNTARSSSSLVILMRVRTTSKACYAECFQEQSSTKCLPKSSFFEQV